MRGDLLQVFGLAEHLEELSFNHAVERAAGLIGFLIAHPVWPGGPEYPGRSRQWFRASVQTCWAERHRVWQGSAAWHYLRSNRSLPDNFTRAATRTHLLREGPWGSMGGIPRRCENAFRRGRTQTNLAWLRRRRFRGTLPVWRGGCAAALRDRGYEGFREGSLYLSTGRGWSPTTDAAIRKLAARLGVQLVAATDANQQGETFDSRLRDIVHASDCDWPRLKPPAEGWNDALRAGNRKKRKEKWKGEESCRMPDGRVKGEASPGKASP